MKECKWILLLVFCCLGFNLSGCSDFSIQNLFSGKEPDPAAYVALDQFDDTDSQAEANEEMSLSEMEYINSSEALPENQPVEKRTSAEES